MTIFPKTINFFRFIFSKIWFFVDLLLKLAWRFIVPIALVGLLLIPIVLTYFPAAKKVDPIAVKAATLGDVTKKITVQGTTEYAYSYDLPVYNDATLSQVLVKAGDKVEEGQVLATLDFVIENKVRSTTIENQIRGFEQEIANNNKSLWDISRTGDASLYQSKTNIGNRNIEIQELENKVFDKKNELSDKKALYEKEKKDFEEQVARLENTKDANDAIKQYQDKIDSLRVQLASFDYSNANATLVAQQSSASTSLSSASTALTSAQTAKNTACATPIIDQNACDTATTVLTSAQNNYNAINNNSSNINTQINNNSNLNSVNRNYLNSQINDYQSRINKLNNSSVVDQNVSTSLPISDVAKTQRIQTLIAELKADITQRETWIKQIDDNKEITTFEDQIKAKQKQVDELYASQNLTVATNNQTIGTTSQRNQLAQTNLNNANLSLNDTIEDILKQENNRTITAKKSGVVGKVFNEQGLVVNSRSNQFTIVSDKFRLKFTVSADSRSQLKNGLKIIADKYPKLENISITEANLVPDAAATGTVATTTNYTIYADLPKSDYNYTQGETVNIDVIINQVKNTLVIPSTAVDNGEVYIGVDPDYSKIKKSSSSSVMPNNSSVSSATSQSSIDPATLPTFKSARKVKVKTGLDDNKNVQILEGLKEGEFVYSMFPKTDMEKKIIGVEIVVGNEPKNPTSDDGSDGLSGVE
jgi:membrane fusion protein, macrolide-specific efflux system